MLASDPSSEFEIVTVQSGRRSLRSLKFGETFHPVVGPMAEAVALHVRQQRLLERARQTEAPFVIWDVGLGAGANAIAVLEAFTAEPAARVELHSFDETTVPLEFAIEHAETLEYITAHRAAISQLLTQREWQAGSLGWHFHLGGFQRTMHSAPAPHAILYDPYSPAANPELWTLEHFTALHGLLDPARACLLTNYTRSTAVRVTLLLAGFFVGHGHATGEKDQTSIAANSLELLEAPLDARWLERVRRSTRSSPLRIGGEGGAIGIADAERLAAHPQFSTTG